MTFKKLSVRLSVPIFILTFLLVQSCMAQGYKKNSGKNSDWEIGFSVGGSKFLNSVNPKSDAFPKRFNYWNSDVKSSLALSVTKTLTEIFSAQFEWQNTKLSGTWNMNNGLAVPLRATELGLSYPDPFETGINQFNIMVIANLNKLIAPNMASDKWYLFAKGGGGEALLNDNHALDKMVGIKFKTSIAYGGGLSVSLSEKLRVKLGTTWYRIESYHLDGAHASAPDDINSVLDIREQYFNAYFGLTYCFGESSSHQALNNNKIWVKSSHNKFKRRR